MLIRLNKLSDQMIKFWSLTSKVKLATLDQPTDKLLSLVISADGKYWFFRTYHVKSTSKMPI
ncbi:MAG: hypothetical protein ACKO7A_08995 [Microcystis sp.]